MMKVLVIFIILALRESSTHNIVNENDQRLRALLSLNEISNRYDGQCFKDLKNVLQLVLLEDENANQSK